MSAFTLRVVDAETARRALDGEDIGDAGQARLGPLDLADLADEAGWLGRFTALSGAPVVLVPNFVRRPHLVGPAPALDDLPAFELDAFAVASVYETVVWDDRAPFWHRDCGRGDSVSLLRGIHDLALRAYRHHDEGERLILVRER